MKTTKKDFELFKKHCDKFLQLLGLTEWSVFYDHATLEGEYGRTYYKLSSGIATIVFAKEWDDLRAKTDSEIERLALHEVLHVMMAPLLSEAAERFTSQDSLDTAEHLIIRRLEKLVSVRGEA